MSYVLLFISLETHYKLVSASHQRLSRLSSWEVTFINNFNQSIVRVDVLKVIYNIYSFWNYLMYGYFPVQPNLAPRECNCVDRGKLVDRSRLRVPDYQRINTPRLPWVNDES